MKNNDNFSKFESRIIIFTEVVITMFQKITSIILPISMLGLAIGIGRGSIVDIPSWVADDIPVWIIHSCFFLLALIIGFFAIIFFIERKNIWKGGLLYRTALEIFTFYDCFFAVEYVYPISSSAIHYELFLNKKPCWEARSFVLI